jgi:hypothetical protein
MITLTRQRFPFTTLMTCTGRFAMSGGLVPRAQSKFDATKKFTRTRSGRDGYSGEFGYPIWGNEANWEYYAHGRAVLLVQIRPGDAQTSTDPPRPLAGDL